jgi:hypothetical protein
LTCAISKSRAATHFADLPPARGLQGRAVFRGKDVGTSTTHRSIARHKSNDHHHRRAIGGYRRCEKGFPYYSGTWRHPQDVVDKLLVPLMRDWDDLSVVVDDFIIAGERVVSLGAYAGPSFISSRAQ